MSDERIPMLKKGELHLTDCLVNTRFGKRKVWEGQHAYLARVLNSLHRVSESGFGHILFACPRQHQIPAWTHSKLARR